MKNDFINPLLIEEAANNGGSIELDFSNQIHYEHIINTIGIKEDNDMKNNKKNDTKGNIKLKSCNYSELMSVIKAQKQKDIDKKRKTDRLMATNTSNVNAGKSGNVYYIMAPACKVEKPNGNLLGSGNLSQGSDKATLITTSVVKYTETKAGIVTDVSLRDSKTGKKIASCLDKRKNCASLLSGIEGDYTDFMGKNTNYITGFGTAITIGEDSDGSTNCSAKLTARTDFTVMSQDAAIQEFIVIDPSIKRPNKPKTEPIKVSYKRDAQLGEYDYSIPNEPSNEKIRLLLPVKFSVQSTEDVTVVDLDRDRGAKLYFDDPNGGQAQYCNDLDDAVVEFKNIGGKTRKMTVTLPQDWNTLYDFSSLEDKISVNMSIYAEFYIKLRLDEGIDISLSVTFKNDDTTTFEDTRNKLIPKIYMQWGCIGKDTLIKRFNQDTNTIENALVSELNINDIVISTNGQRAAIRNIVTGEDEYIWNIVTSNHTIKLSPSHSICTERGWIPVSDIRTDDMIITEDGAEKIIEFDYKLYNEKVYNFIFEEETPIYGNGILIGDYQMQQRIRPVLEEKVNFSQKTYKAVEELFALMSK